ncbi:MAG: hypothetical protein RBR50_00785 [Candidatus Izemoplasmatales bacterium]|nr:hypothetical protein [Candidatus Izemoplasmatales bacterium]
MKKIKLIVLILGVITIVSTIISVVIAIRNGVGPYGKHIFPFSFISSISLLTATVLSLVIRNHERNTNRSKVIIDAIKRLNKKGKFNSYQYFYTIMYEMKFGGRALTGVGEKDFYNKNWRMLIKKFRRTIVGIHDMYMNKPDDFNLVFEYLSTKTKDEKAFEKWVKNPSYRLLKIKDLHDSMINKITYDKNLQELSTIVDVKYAIDIIPLRSPIEVRFKTSKFMNIENKIEGLNSILDSNTMMIHGISKVLNNGVLPIYIDYTVYSNDLDDVDFIDLDFICEDIKVTEI